jgi:hypothetical protein
MSVSAHMQHYSSRAADERARVRQHLAGAERLARRGKPALGPIAALNRALLLEELRHYRQRGRFPRNLDARSKPAPQFIDEHGTRCAVAHLMEVSGQVELVQHIARTDNGAYVRELVRLPEVRAWLGAAGLSLDEATRIQPAYCYYVQAEACFCDGGERHGVAVATVTGVEAGSVRLRIERIDGELLGLSVGDERTLTTLAPLPGLGGQMFVSYSSDYYPSDPEPAMVLERAGSRLSVNGDAVTCNYDASTARRLVSVDTAIEAMLEPERGACVAVLASDDSNWNQSECDGEQAGESGCGLASPAGGALVTGELTSMALLAALLLHRRWRR